MSADNGHIVCNLHDYMSEYGIFYYSASSDYPPQWYSRKNAVAIYKTPIEAIIMGHKVESESPTEYGLHVHSLTLREAIKALP